MHADDCCCIHWKFIGRACFLWNMLLLGQNNVFQLHKTFIIMNHAALLKLQQYKRNEQAFDHDLHRFMLRNGLQVQTKTTWHHTKVGLFQLFMAVFERGGYQKVSFNQYNTFGRHFYKLEILENLCKTLPEGWHRFYDFLHF